MSCGAVCVYVLIIIIASTWHTEDGYSGNKVVAVGANVGKSRPSQGGPNQATEDNKAIHWGREMRKDSAGRLM